MRRVALALSMVWLLTSVATSAPILKGKADDIEKLAGLWVATEIVIEGEKRPEKQVAGTKMRFNKDKIEYTLPTPDEATVVSGPASAFSFKLDPTKTPKEINLVPLDGLWKDLKMPGIYHLDGDTLTICFHDAPSEERPKEFIAPKGSTIVVMKFKRPAK